MIWLQYEMGVPLASVFVILVTIPVTFRKWAFRDWEFRDWEFRKWEFRKWEFRKWAFSFFSRRRSRTCLSLSLKRAVLGVFAFLCLRVFLSDLSDLSDLSEVEVDFDLPVPEVAV